jgi:ribosome-binding factor A
MAEDRRIEKVNALIRDELAGIVAEDVQFLQGVLVTITRVISSHDLHYADVFVSVFPKKEKEVIALLNKKIAYIQGALNKKLKMRPVPRIMFKIDEEEKSRERIEKILTKIEGDTTQK